MVTKNLLTSPADGIILSIIETDNNIQIAIFLSILDVHVQYSPCDGTIVAQRYKTGEFHPAYIMKKSRYNERMETDIMTADGNMITVIQIAGQLANRIETFVHKGMMVSRGCRLGIIKFGSRVDLIVPKNKYMLPKNIAIGKYVTAGETVLFKTRNK
jgi:phosphatidylserine decarboxylase